MPGFRMLAFKLWRGRVHSKTFESFLLPLHNPILNKFELTHTFKTVQKSCLENFQINMKNKLDNIWETTEKESSHLDLYLKSYSQSKFSQSSIFK